MRITVCIVGYRNTQDIAQCLEALAGSTHRDFEVVICENGGVAAFEQLQAVLPKVLAGGQTVSVIRAEHNLGYAGGVNVCLEASPAADAWWILNPDTQAEPQALAALAERLGRGDCEAVGGIIRETGEAPDSVGGRWIAALGQARALLPDSLADTRTFEARLSYISGASLLIGRRFREVAGLMREDYFLYCEEVEWCLRGLKRGLRLGFAPDAVVVHHTGSTTGSAAPLRSRPKAPIYLDTRNRVLLTRDCFPGLTIIAAPAVLAYMILRYLRRGAFRQLGYAVAGWWAGVRNLRGRPGWY